MDNITIHIYVTEKNLESKVRSWCAGHLESLLGLDNMSTIVNIDTIKEFVHHSNEIGCFWCFYTSCKWQHLWHWITQDLHIQNVCAIITHSWLLTWAATSTHILENEVRETCSNLIFGIILSPSPPAVSWWYRSVSLGASMWYIFHCTTLYVKIITCTSTDMYTTDKHTHRFCFWEDQQFLAVFMRCGGSASKKKSQSENQQK